MGCWRRLGNGVLGWGLRRRSGGRGEEGSGGRDPEVQTGVCKGWRFWGIKKDGELETGHADDGCGYGNIYKELFGA